MKELANVKEYFIELYKEHEDLTKASRHNYHKYCLLFGAALYERYQSYLNCMRLKRKLELCRSFIDRRANIDHLEVEKTINEELTENFDELREILADYVEAVFYFRGRRPSPEEKKKMSRIFYKIADLVHPVAGGETGEARRDLWEKTIEAYESDDLKTLRECEIVANNFFRDLPDALTDADLKTLIDAYRGKIAEYKEKNKEIVESFPYNVGDLLADEEYIAKELAKLADENRSYREKAEEYYKALEDILPTLDGENIGRDNET